jgi:hypothetical protein
MKTMPKKTSAAQWFTLSCGGLIILALISTGLVFQSISRNWDSDNWDNQLATLIATDNSITAPGDGAHAVPINTNDVLEIGETGVIFNIEITLDNAAFIKSAENVSGAWEYWAVEFSGKSLSDAIEYGVNPSFDSQVQYLQGFNYIWNSDESGQSQCDDEQVMDGFEIGEAFHCRLIYVVPADERNLYWVYTRTDLVADECCEERYVFFQIR